MVSSSFRFCWFTRSTFSLELFLRSVFLSFTTASSLFTPPPSPVVSAFLIPASLAMPTTMLLQEDLIDKHEKLRNAIENLPSKYQKDVGRLTYVCAQEAKKCGFEVSLPRLISHIKRSSVWYLPGFRWDVAFKRGGMSGTTSQNVHACAGNCFP